jgi:hypothetical protein
MSLVAIVDSGETLVDSARTGAGGALKSLQDVHPTVMYSFFKTRLNSSVLSLEIPRTHADSVLGVYLESLHSMATDANIPLAFFSDKRTAFGPVYHRVGGPENAAKYEGWLKNPLSAMHDDLCKSHRQGGYTRDFVIDILEAYEVQPLLLERRINIRGSQLRRRKSLSAIDGPLRQFSNV